MQYIVLYFVEIFLLRPQNFSRKTPQRTVIYTFPRVGTGNIRFLLFHFLLLLSGKIVLRP